MRKLKFGLLSLLLFTYLFSATKITFAQNSTIDIQNSYFTNYNINDGNRSNVILNYKGTNGFGLFFLGNSDTEGTYTLTLNNTEITCTKQLKGYYTNNFLNFKLFPLDSSINLNNGVTFNEGGLYYDCKRGTIDYTGVYGHIKWTYKKGNDSATNTHEIRAGVDDRMGNRILTTSQLKLIDNGVNYRALSGLFRDYLAKRATVLADFNEGIFIDYPDEYFINTKAFSGNRNETYFNDSGNYGFGLFFLGTGIENGPYEITDNAGIVLSCSGQLDGYYSFSFNDFGMLPLDQATKNYENQYNTEYNIDVDGGLYYNCRQKNTNTIYTGVYGHVKRNYNYGNIHEIRAGIKSDGSFYNQSPIEVIYSDNFRNVNRTLSGQFHDNLSKNSITLARFFGDLGIIIGDNTEIKASGTLDDPYFVIPYADYKNNTKIYIKSSKTDTSLELHLTAFDSNGQQHNSNNTYNLDSLRTNFGFYSYKTTSNNILGSITSNEIKSGTINAILHNLHDGTEIRSKTIRFVITGSSDAPTITVNFSGTDCSKTGVTITAISSGTIKYAITNTDACNQNSNYTFLEYPNDGIYLTGAHLGKYICFRATYAGNTGYYSRTVTGIDTYGPTFNLISWDGFECETGELKITNRQGIGCSLYTDQYYWNGSLGENTYKLYSGGIGSKIMIGMIKDSLGNTTEHTGQFTRQNSIPQLERDTLNYEGTVIGTTILYTNLITQMGVTDGACGNSTITKTGNINCTSGSASWSGNGIVVTPPDDNYVGQISCTVNFADDEGSIATGTVTYHIDVPPTITIIGPNPGSCNTGQKISATATKPGTTMQRCIGDDINVCETCETNHTWENYTPGTIIPLNNEDYNGKYICFKATDTEGRIIYEKTGIDNIDTTPPTIFTQVGVSYGKSFDGNNFGECSTINVQISAVDNGCGKSKMKLIIAGQTILSDRDGSDYTTGINIGNQIGDINLNISVVDDAGNRKDEELSFSSEDAKLTGTGFRKSLKHNGGAYTATGNWKDLTHAQAGDCENIRIKGYDCHDKGGLTYNNNRPFDFTYTYIGDDPTDLHCELIITDGDSDITVTANFYDCTQDKDSCKPQLTPIFTGCLEGQFDNCRQSKYTHYEETNHHGKYTSGTTARIQINGQGVSDLSGYRFTCVQQGRYCKRFAHREYEDIYYNNTPLSFISQNNLDPQICNDRVSSRSRRKKYDFDGEPDIFTMILNNEEGACNTINIPYGSRNQGTRKVWIELEDIEGNTGIAYTDDIIYSTIPPEIKLTNTRTRGFRNDRTQTNAMKINNGEFTVNISVNAADLPYTTSGQNYQYANIIQGIQTLRFEPSQAWYINYPNTKEWLITHYGNIN